MTNTKEKKIKIAEIVLAAIIAIYAIVMLALGTAGGDFFYVEMTTAERIVFWIAAAVGTLSFFLAAFFELRSSGRQRIHLFSLFVVCVGFLPLLANAYSVLKGQESLMRAALGIVSCGLIMTGFGRAKSIIAFIAYAVGIAGLFLPDSEIVLRAWIIILFLLPVLSVAFSQADNKKLILIRVSLCLIGAALCVAGFVWKRELYAVAAVYCMIYALLCVWLDSKAQKSVKKEKSVKEKSAKKKKIDEEKEPDQPFGFYEDDGSLMTVEPGYDSDSDESEGAMAEDTSDPIQLDVNKSEDLSLEDGAIMLDPLADEPIDFAPVEITESDTEDDEDTFESSEEAVELKTEASAAVLSDEKAELTVEEKTTEKPEHKPEKKQAAREYPAVFSGESDEIVGEIVREFEFTDTFGGMTVFILDNDGTWYRYIPVKKAVVRCDNRLNPSLDNLIDMKNRHAVIKSIEWQESCEIPCRMWNEDVSGYTDVLVKSVTVPDGRKYILIFNTSAVTKNEKDTITGLEDEVERLNSIIDEKNRDERRIFFSVNEFLISLIERRSEESVKHLNNISLCTSILLTHAQRLYPEMKITDEFIRDVSDAAIFHDVGKIEISDAVLTKAGKFTPEEYEEMKHHTVYGGEIINRMPYAKSQEQIMKYAYEIAIKHHERIDGNGYPKGLTEKDIPFYVQIVSLADVYEALLSKRVYKDPIPFETALNMIRNGESGKFSDKVLNCLDDSLEDFKDAQLV